MSYQSLFFDLDGTLTDSSQGILNSVCHALNKLGIAIPPRERLLRFIGPPLSRVFSEDYGLTHEEALHAVELYREYYFVKGKHELRVYDGIPALLCRAKELGYRLAIATCKPTVLAREVLTNCNLAHYFDLISGPELDGTRGEKHEVIAHALQQLGNPDPDRILMIGDRRDDAEGAVKNGIRCAGVLWGFGSVEELQSAGASMLFHTPDNLLSFLENRPSFHEN